jgi:hypothetical protein
MQAQITEVSSRPVRKRSKKPKVAALANCPVNGAGWCPYPFSPAQLERRLRQKLESEIASASKTVSTSNTRTRAVSAKSK